MFRRRRRRSSFARPSTIQPWMLLAVGGVAFIAAFIFFMRQADTLAPPQQEIRVELPDAFKDSP